jgi:hypothetical protein
MSSNNTDFPKTVQQGRQQSKHTPRKKKFQKKFPDEKLYSILSLSIHEAMENAKASP